MSNKETVNTEIRIFYDPPPNSAIGLRCGGEGNDWQKFYYATKKGNAWVCVVPMVKDGANTLVEFKPVIQFGASPPPPPSDLSAVSPSIKYSFTSSDLRALFNSSESVYYGMRRSSSISFGVDGLAPGTPGGIGGSLGIPGTPPTPSSFYAIPRTPPTPSPSVPSVAPPSPSPTLKSKKMPLPTPVPPPSPSIFVMEAGKEETYAIGANYSVKVGQGRMDVHPWFFNWCGKIDVLEDFESKIMGNKRRIIVYLPPSYEENKQKSYPVLVMQDAHNLFFENLSFCGRTWKIPFTMNELCAAGIINEHIIVALTPIERFFEYLPAAPDGRGNGGGADKYLDFVGIEVKKMIINKYRTNGEYGIAGSSYGGIISLYAWLTRPDEYTKCGCYSPSLKWHHKYLVQLAKQLVEKFNTTHKKHEIYLDAGTDHDQLLATANLARLLERALNRGRSHEEKYESNEETPRALEVLNKLASATGVKKEYFGGIKHVQAVNSYGAVLDSGKVMLNVGEGHNHSEDSWAKRTPLAFAYLMRDHQRDQRWANDVVDNISWRVMD